MATDARQLGHTIRNEVLDAYTLHFEPVAEAGNGSILIGLHKLLPRDHIPSPAEVRAKVARLFRRGSASPTAVNRPRRLHKLASWPLTRVFGLGVQLFGYASRAGAAAPAASAGIGRRR